MGYYTLTFYLLNIACNLNRDLLINPNFVFFNYCMLVKSFQGDFYVILKSYNTKIFQITHLEYSTKILHDPNQ